MKIDKGHKMTLSAPCGGRVTVRLEINPRAKRLILRVDEQAREAVAVAPSKRDLAAAAGFAAERAGWILERLEAMPQSMPFEEGAEIPVRGALVRLTALGGGRIARLEPGAPPRLVAPGDPDTLAARALRFLKKEARADIETAVARHSAGLGVEPAGIAIKDTRSRWGSCTSDRRLSFSWRLVCAPPEVLDYVAAHECAHMLEMNHSKAFWGHVERVCPDWRVRRNWLRSDEGRALHAVGV